MARLTYDVSMSLDGFITGPDPRRDAPLGDGGERLHGWLEGMTDYRADRRSVRMPPTRTSSTTRTRPSAHS